MTTDNETKVENENENAAKAKAKADEGTEDSAWGFSAEGSGISRETKIGLALIFILLSAFGFVVFRKMNPPQGQPTGDDAPAVAGEDVAKPGADSDSPNGFDPAEDATAGGVGRQSGFVAGDSSGERPGEFGFNGDSQTPEANSQTAGDFGSEQSFGGGTDRSAPGQQSEPDVAGAFDADDPFAGNASRETNAGTAPAAATTPRAQPLFGLGDDDTPPTGFQPNSQDVADSRNNNAEFGSEASFSDPRTATADAVNPNSEAVPTGLFGNPIPAGGSNPAKAGNDAATAASQDRVFVGDARTDDGFGQVRTNGFDGAPTTASFDGRKPSTANDNRLGGFSPTETAQRETSSRTVVQSVPSEPPRFGNDFTADKPAAISTTDFNLDGDDVKAAGDVPAQMQRTADDNGGFERPFPEESRTEPKPVPTLDLANEVPVRKPVPATSFDGGGIGGADSNNIESKSFQPPVHTSEPAFDTASPITRSARPARLAAISGADEYVVQPNENFWSISKKKYGTVRYFQALTEFNKARVPDPTRMRLGTKILLPSPQELAARFPALLPKSARSDQFASAAGSRTGVDNSKQPLGFFLSPTGQPMFRVGGDDTLTSISKDHLGRSSRWIQVYNLNRDRVQNPDKLNIGLVLRLPADASQVRLSPTAGAFR